MQASHDLIVVQLHHGIPPIDQLREMGERQAFEHDARRQMLAAIHGADFGNRAIELDTVMGRFEDECRMVLPAVLLPRDLCLRCCHECFGDACKMLQ